MYTFILRLSAAVFTFFVGTMVASVWAFVSAPEVKVNAVAETQLILVGPQKDDGLPTPPPPPQAAFGPKAIVSGGVLNGKAISKPQPVYPPIAKAARAQGTVTVQIVVGEEGDVISAQAVSGHPLLQQAAAQAARQARFSPTLLSGQPVKVSGVITYNFILQ